MTGSGDVPRPAARYGWCASPSALCGMQAGVDGSTRDASPPPHGPVPPPLEPWRRRSASDGLGELRKALRTRDDGPHSSRLHRIPRSAAAEEARDRELLLAYLRHRFPHATGCCICTVPDHNPPETEPTPATSTGWGGAW